MSHGPSRGAAVAVIASFSLSLLLPGRPEAASVQLIQAGGRPYVDCVSAPVRLARMERGMGVQQEALRRAEAHLRQAESGNAEATQETEEAILEQARDWAQEKLTLTRKVKALKELGLTPEKRRRFLELVQEVEDSLEKITEIKDEIADAGQKADALASLMENGVNLQNLATFLDESGMSDEAATAAATALLGPAGLGVVEGFMLARDLAFTGVKQVLSDQELAQARRTYEALKHAVDLNRERIDILRELSSKYCTPPEARPQDPPPPTPAPETKPKEKKFSEARLLGVLGGAAVLSATGLYLSSQLSDLALDSTESGGSSGSGQPKLVGSPRFTCSGSQCTGTIVVNFPSPIRSGYVTAATSAAGFLGQASVSSGYKGDVTIAMSRPYNFCYQTQTGLALWDARTMDGPNTWSLTVSIPVTCN